jgi:hypothetical protein
VEAHIRWRPAGRISGRHVTGLNGGNVHSKSARRSITIEDPAWLVVEPPSQNIPRRQKGPHNQEHDGAHGPFFLFRAAARLGQGAERQSGHVPQSRSIDVLAVLLPLSPVV